MRGEATGPSLYARAAAGALLIFATAGALAATVLALGLGDRTSLDVSVSPIATRGGAAAAPEADPFAWDTAEQADFETRAASSRPRSEPRSSAPRSRRPPCATGSTRTPSRPSSSSRAPGGRR